MIPTGDLPWRTFRLKKGNVIFDKYYQVGLSAGLWLSDHNSTNEEKLMYFSQNKMKLLSSTGSSQNFLWTSSACSCLPGRVQVTASCWMSWWECSSWEGVGARTPVSSTEENIELKAYWQRYSKIWYLSSIRKTTACPGSFWNLLWTVSCNL